MKKKKIILPIVAVAIAVATIGTTTFVYASENGFGWRGSAGHEEMKAAIENDDYATWKNLVNDKVAEFASEENFSNMKQIHELMADGKLDEVKALKEELGMPGGRGYGMKGEMSAMREAVENEDYEVWKTAMEDSIVSRLDDVESKINEDTFTKLIEAHQAMETGDFEGAKQIREDLGFPTGPKDRKGDGMGRGMFGYK